MTTILGDTKIEYPVRCISYYASDKSNVDGKHSYEFWTRSKLTRIVCNKPFSRGDVLEIQNVENTSTGIVINTVLIDEWQEEYPVLNFISGRLVYNKDSDFECVPSEGIKIIQPIEQILSNNYSIGFICLIWKSGKISCIDKWTNNKFDIHVRLSFE